MICCCRSLSSVYRTGLRQSGMLLVIAASTRSFDYPSRELLVGNLSSKTDREDSASAVYRKRAPSMPGCLPLGLTDAVL